VKSADVNLFAQVLKGRSGCASTANMTDPVPKRYTLLIDNYDSYSYNLFQLIAGVNGVPPIVCTNDNIQVEEVNYMHQ
jgi:hypothetical protein